MASYHCFNSVGWQCLIVTAVEQHTPLAPGGATQLHGTASLHFSICLLDYLHTHFHPGPDYRNTLGTVPDCHNLGPTRAQQFVCHALSTTFALDLCDNQQKNATFMHAISIPGM